MTTTRLTSKTAKKQAKADGTDYVEPDEQTLPDTYIEEAPPSLEIAPKIIPHRFSLDRLPDDALAYAMQDVADYLINSMISEAEIVVSPLLDNWKMKAIPPTKSHLISSHFVFTAINTRRDFDLGTLAHETRPGKGFGNTWRRTQTYMYVVVSAAGTWSLLYVGRCKGVSVSK